MNTVLVVAAHPDDEVLGCGGTIRVLADAGAEVWVLFLADGEGSRSPQDLSAQRAARQAAAQEAVARLGARVHGFCDLPDNQLDTVPLLEVIRPIETVARALQPELVLTHHAGDLNLDHGIVSRAVMTAFRPTPGHRCCEVRAFEVPSATEWGFGATGASFVPDTYVDIAATLAEKLAAYEAYGDEVPADPHARSLHAVRCRAELRGREVGLAAAEAFVTMRRVLRP